MIVGPRPYGKKEDLALTTSTDPLPLKRRQGGPIYLSAAQHFHFERDPRYAREWKVKTDSYAYHVRVSEDPEGELFAWHWHPGVREGCHLHIGARQRSRALQKLHVPTGRLSFEEVLRFLIDELEVVPTRTDFDATLSDSQARFEAYRTWPSGRPG